MRRSITLCIFIAVLVPSACSPPPRIFMDRGIGSLGGNRVALLPLDNLSGVDGASQVMDEVLLVELLRLGTFEVVDPGTVEEALLDLRIRRTSALSREETDSLAQRLSVRALIAGSLLEYTTKSPRAGSGNPVPAISLSLRMIDTQTAEIVWGATHSRTGDDAEKVFGLGKISSEAELGKVIAREIFQSLQSVSWRSS